MCVLRVLDRLSPAAGDIDNFVPHRLDQFILFSCIDGPFSIQENQDPVTIQGPVTIQDPVTIQKPATISETGASNSVSTYRHPTLELRIDVLGKANLRSLTLRVIGPSGSGRTTVRPLFSSVRVPNRESLTH